MTSWLDAIREISSLDPGRRVFGADYHQYEIRPIEEREVLAVEERQFGRFPEGYRRYLLEVGDIVGPYYGLCRFAEIERYREEDVIGNSWQMLRERVGAPLNWPEDLVSSIVNDTAADVPYPEPRSKAGWIELCYHGCTFWTVMVTSGPLSGRVFETDAPSGTAMWRSPRRPPGIIVSGREPTPLPPLSNWPSFDEWMQSWIDRCIHDLRQA